MLSVLLWTLGPLIYVGLALVTARPVYTSRYYECRRGRHIMDEVYHRPDTPEEAAFSASCWAFWCGLFWPCTAVVVGVVCSLMFVCETVAKVWKRIAAHSIWGLPGRLITGGREKVERELAERDIANRT